MAIQSKEFVGIAEGIKSHELSTKGKIESLKGMISELSGAKRSLQSQISYLEAALAAAYEDTDEDDEPDYGRIVAIEAQINEAQNDLSEVEYQLDTGSGELSELQVELDDVMEEKARTLFEIQERARKTSNNITIAGGMYGAYAGVGASLQSSMQTSLASLSQAASILDGSVDGFAGGSGNSGNNSTGGKGVPSQGTVPTSVLSAFVVSDTAGSDAPVPRSFTTNHTNGATPAITSGFCSSQKSINSQKTSNFSSRQSGNAYAVTAFSESDDSIVLPSSHKYKTSQISKSEVSHFDENNKAQRLIPGTPGKVTIKVDKTGKPSGNSSILAKNLFNEFDIPMESYSDEAKAKINGKMPGYQAQHIIPVEMYNHPIIVKIGMDMNNAQNGIPLPVPSDSSHALSTHKGYHAIYSRIVRESLDGIAEKVGSDATIEQIEFEVAKLQQKLKSALKSGLPMYARKNDALEHEVWDRGGGATMDMWRKFLNKDDSCFETDSQGAQDELERGFAFGMMASKFAKRKNNSNVQVTHSAPKSSEDIRREFIQRLQADVESVIRPVNSSVSSDDVDDTSIEARVRERQRDKDHERGLFNKFGLGYHTAQGASISASLGEPQTRNPILARKNSSKSGIFQEPRSLSRTAESWTKGAGNTMTYNTPIETGKKLDFQQGKVENFEGTCGLVSCVNVLRMAGVSITESDIVKYASTTYEDNTNPFIASLTRKTLCTTNSAPSSNGGTSAASRKRILDHFGIPSRTAPQSIETIAQAVSSGYGVIASVHAEILYFKRRPIHPDLHAITITSVQRDTTGKILGFYVCDSNAYALGGTGATYYTADEIKEALSERECNITTTIIR